MTRLTPAQVEAIERLAKAARTGRWFKDDSPPPPNADSTVEREADVAARLITALSPETVLALLAERAELERKLAAAEAERDEALAAMNADTADVALECASLRARLEAAEAKAGALDELEIWAANAPYTILEFQVHTNGASVSLKTPACQVQAKGRSLAAAIRSAIGRAGERA